MEPRIVEIVVHTYTVFPGKRTYSVFTTRTPPPAVLHVYRKAREIGFKHYTRMFRESPVGLVCQRGRVIYLNSKRDTVCLTSGYNQYPPMLPALFPLGFALFHENLFYPETAGLIERIAIPAEVVETRLELGLALSALPGLREAVLVFGPINIRGRRTVRFVDASIRTITQWFGRTAIGNLEEMKNDVARFGRGLENNIPPLISFKRLQRRGGVAMIRVE